MSKSGTQSKTGTKVSKKAEKTPKKALVKNEQKTKKVNGRLFSKDCQPEKRGRPAGIKDFSTVFDEVSKGEGRAVAVFMLWQKIKEKDFQAIKLAIEYLFEKPKETVVNENKEPLKIEIGKQTEQGEKNLKMLSEFLKKENPDDTD